MGHLSYNPIRDFDQDIISKILKDLNISIN